MGLVGIKPGIKEDHICKNRYQLIVKMLEFMLNYIEDLDIIKKVDFSVEKKVLEWKLHIDVFFDKNTKKGEKVWFVEASCAALLKTYAEFMVHPKRKDIKPSIKPGKGRAGSCDFK